MKSRPIFKARESHGTLPTNCADSWDAAFLHSRHCGDTTCLKLLLLIVMMFALPLVSIMVLCTAVIKSFLVAVFTSLRPQCCESWWCGVWTVSDDDEGHDVSDADVPLAIIDTGCTRTMIGHKQLKQLHKKLKLQGHSIRIDNHRQVFRGIGGQTVSKSTAIIPVGIGGHEGYIRAHIMPKRAPFLLSHRLLKQFGTVLNLAESTMSMSTIGVEELPISLTSTGHPAVNVLNFPTSLPFERSAST